MYAGIYLGYSFTNFCLFYFDFLFRFNTKAGKNWQNNNNAFRDHLCSRMGTRSQAEKEKADDKWCSHNEEISFLVCGLHRI